MRGRSRFSINRYRRERFVALERRVEFLEAERHRLERLLALALKLAVSGTKATPPGLLDVLCEFDVTNPARGAVFEERGS